MRCFWYADREVVIYFMYNCIILPPFIWWQSSLRFDFSGKVDEEQQEESDENKRVLVVSKLHAILRPFLLRRMKEDVELTLPRKKEIIIYANMTEHQKQIQNHLVEETFDEYLHENMDIGMQGSCMWCCILILNLVH
jgi:SNF2 family DNA or RNA helicase